MITCYRRKNWDLPASTLLKAISSRISGAEDDQSHPMQSKDENSAELSHEDHERRPGQDTNDLQEQSSSENIFGEQNEKNSLPTARRWSQVMSVSPEFMALAQAQFEALASTMDAER
jgi:hypothetical protein